jgi:hypothetical protein
MWRSSPQIWIAGSSPGDDGSGKWLQKNLTGQPWDKPGDDGKVGNVTEHCVRDAGAGGSTIIFEIHLT